MAVAVISSIGKKLMPTSEYKARKLLKSGRAEIYQYKPVFTIRLKDRREGETQLVEYSSDTGKYHVGVSIKSEKHEYVNAVYDMLKDEKERHDNCRRYRRIRRNRLRYRKPRFNNRSKANKEMAPSIRHIEENQLRLFDDYCKVMPISSACFEVGKFDTQLLEAMETGRPLPHGSDYQHGAAYQMETRRKAVLYRDNYTCQLCGRSIKDGAILCLHHIGMHKDHSNRMSNLVTLCTKCHTSKNRQPGGKFYGWKPKLKRMDGASYMNQVSWDFYHKLVLLHPEVEIHIQYGAETAVTRHKLHLMKDKSDVKNHAVDAYCIGKLHPLHRCRTKCWQKKRRNNRVLSKFYDAKYIDIRTGKAESGAYLGCGRTNRREMRNSDKNERIYRGMKVRKGHVSIRKRRYPLQPGNTVMFNNVKQVVKGVHNGKNVEFMQDGKLPKSASVSKVKLLSTESGWHFLLI